LDSQGNEFEGRYRLKTKETVSHAEANVFSKMLRAGLSAKSGTLFVTIAPCLFCAKQIVESGTAEVYYLNEYRNLDGVNWLITNGVKVIKLD
jgi:dCMP deaminase